VSCGFKKPLYTRTHSLCWAGDPEEMRMSKKSVCAINLETDKFPMKCGNKELTMWTSFDILDTIPLFFSWYSYVR
jgi:hypothetical protein